MIYFIKGFTTHKIISDYKLNLKSDYIKMSLFKKILNYI